MATGDYLWLLVATGDYWWLLVTIGGYWWQLVATGDILLNILNYLIECIRYQNFKVIAGCIFIQLPWRYTTSEGEDMEKGKKRWREERERERETE